MGTKTINADLTAEVENTQGKLLQTGSQKRIEAMLGTSKRYRYPSLFLARVRVKMSSVVIGKKPPIMAPKTSDTVSEKANTLRPGLVLYRRSPKMRPWHPLFKHMDEVFGGKTRTETKIKKKKERDLKLLVRTLYPELPAMESNEAVSTSFRSSSRSRSRRQPKKQDAAKAKSRQGSM